MDGLTVEVFGNKAILDNLDKFSEEIQAKAQQKLEEAAAMALERAQELVPVRTGYLKSQLYAEVQPGIVTIGDDAPYAVFLEIGTSRMRPQPYLVPAWIEAGRKLKDELRGLI